MTLLLGFAVASWALTVFTLTAWWDDTRNAPREEHPPTTGCAVIIGWLAFNICLTAAAAASLQ